MSAQDLRLAENRYAWPITAAKAVRLADPNEHSARNFQSSQVSRLRKAQSQNGKSHASIPCGYVTDNIVVTVTSGLT